MLRLVFLLGVVLVVSCGGDDGPPGSISGDGCDECGEFETVLESICGGIDRCPDFVYPIGYRSQGECVAILAWATTCFVDDDGQEVDEAAPEVFVRRIPELTSEQAAACAGYIDAASCDELNALMQGRAEDTPCFDLGNAGDAFNGGAEGDDPVPEPNRPNQLGDRCNGGHEDCDINLYCHQPNALLENSLTYACATCRNRPTLGEPCRPYYEPCIDGLRCLQEDEGKTGYDYYGECSKLGEVGEDCTNGSECQSQFCDRYDASTLDRRCAEGGREGDPCGAGGSCVQGFVCIGPEDARVCTEVKQNGESCSYAQECSSRECDADGRCGLATGSEENCNSHSECRSQYCKASQCAETVGLGASCQEDAECGQGVCGRSSNTCIEAFCQNDSDCTETQYCGSYAECIERRPEGSNCFSDEECLSNYCNSDERCGQETSMGGPCQSNSQCYPWGACEGGMCVPLKDPGESCTGLQSCKPPFICQNGRCELINISCVPAEVGQSCASLRVCEAEATCDFAGGIVCKPRGGLGEQCVRATDCELDFYCARSRTCEARPTAGQPCDSDMPCAAEHNCVYDNETSESSCVAAPEGDPCDTERPCPEGYHCGLESRCEPPLSVGDPCDPYSGEVCPQDSYCNADTRICTASPTTGQSCGYQVPCGGGSHCNEMTMQCVADLSNGTPCDYPGASCVEGYGCVPDDLANTSGPKTCRKLLTDGESCVSGLECLGGSCLALCDSSDCLTRVCVSGMCVPPTESDA